MWAPPNIKRLNEEAAKDAEATEALAETPEKVECLYCDQPATEAWPYYDIFSEDPKGVVGLCEEHAQDGTPEGYFWCDGCGRLMIENYTWETYYVHTDDGAYCLRCYAEAEIENPENWFDPAKVVGVGEAPDSEQPGRARGSGVR
jgi:hypothetical protein